MCKRVCILKQGQILALDTPEKLKASIGYDFRLDIYPQQSTFTQTKEFS
jgi:ABC-type multidrug transport system ATPase subunit